MQIVTAVRGCLVAVLLVTCVTARAADFTVPPGFTVQVVAGPPLVERPVMATFDDRGRLFVADNVGLNMDDAGYDAQLPNLMRMLEDTNGDGVFDRSTVFADKMTFPQGALWYQGALYVASPPNIWRLQDIDGDGRADRREIIASGFKYTGNAADVHGPFLHPGGRIFWCHGRKGHEVHQKDGRLVSRAKGARIWSAKPDGSDIQVFAGGGMDNPVEVTFTPEGEVLGDANLFYSDPRGDVLIHWVRGGVYPRYDQEAVLAEFRRTGDPLKDIFNFGHGAVSGLTLARSAALGYQGNVFVSLFNTRKVTRSVLVPRGSTFAARTEDFFTVHDPDAHLTDVFEDADGSLMILNTGGWFRRGCPASEISKPQATGAIYRVRKPGHKVTDPRGLGLPWDGSSTAQLVRWLDDPRFAVRDRAVEALALRQPTVVEGTPLQKQGAIWALTRNGSPEALRAIRSALGDPHEKVRQTACNSVATTGDPDAAPALLPLLRRGGAAVRRAAAAALGRTGAAAAVGPLVTALAQPGDRFLEHALVHALIELDDYTRTRPGLDSGNPLQKARTLMALDQMASSRLDAATVLPLLVDRAAPVRKVAVDIASRRAAWAPALATRARAWLAARALSGPALQAMQGTLPKHLRDEAVKEVVGRMLGHGERSAVTAAFKILAGASDLALHPSWLGPFERHLGGTDPRMLAAAVEAAKHVKDERLYQPLHRIVTDPGRPAGLRLAALAAVARPTAALDTPSFKLLFDLLGAASTPQHATAAARFLGEAKLSAAQLQQLAPVIAAAGPLERPFVLKAFGRSRDREVGLALAKILAEMESLPGVKFGELVDLFKSYPPEVMVIAQPVLDRFQAQSDGRKAHLIGLEKALDSGDPKKGRVVFQSGKGACITCHQIGNFGHAVGPNLSHIGRIRTPRDLLESVVSPSATIAQGFEPFVVETAAGDSRFGVVRRETAEAVYLVDAAGETSIPRSQVKRMAPGQTSLMPEGLDQALGQRDLVDLVAFLKSLN